MPPPDALLPVLVAELADAAARRMVEELAQARRVCLVPVVDPPVDASLHVLEITTPEERRPLLVLAEPAGAPTERGFPLRLHPYDAPPRGRSTASELGPTPSVRATRTRPTTLSKRHTRDLLGEESFGEANLDAEADAAALVGREIAGKLVIEQLVGVGGMGAVYRARHKHLAKQVAVKVLHARFRDDLGFCARFHAEALAISQLDHPNVVRILDYGQEPDGLLYLAMDFLSGIELQELLQREGTLPLPRIVDICVQVSAGLGHAHARGIIHRDVKPSNIVLVRTEDDEGGTIEVAKVCDFGIAAAGGDTRDLLGTPAYMSPEQCEGSGVDGRSDVYALGVILYELSTGQLPFSHDDPTKTINMQLNKEPPPPSLIRPIDSRLESLILKTLSKSPADRPQSMRDLRRDLRALLRPPSIKLHEVGAGRAERDPHAYDDNTLPPQSSPRISAPVSAVNPQALAAELAREPVSRLREALVTDESFAKEARVIATAMRFMLAQGELAALAHVVAIFRKVAFDPNAGRRGEISASLVRSLMDPTLLAPVAEKAITEHDETAPKLLAGLGLAAAHALYGARVRAHATPPVRGRFVEALRAIGLPAWPLLHAALQRNAPDAGQYDPRLAEDLLRAIPNVADESAGGLVAKYLRWGDAAVRRAAMVPLASLWGDRARALLLAVLVKDTDDGARIAALRGLRNLKAIDEHVVRKAEDMLAEGAVTSTAPAGDALKAAVAEALSEANEEAKAHAAAALRRQLTPKGGVFGMLRSRTPAMAPSVLLAMARAYAAVANDDAAKLIDELARGAEDPLKTQLTGLLPR